MSISFLNNVNAYKFTGILQAHFDLFSSGHTLIVHKEPQQTISNSNSSYYAGYEETSNEDNVTYTYISGAFPVVRVYSKENEKIMNELNTSLQQGTVRIKVSSIARDYIKNGKNEYFELDGMTFNEALEDSQQSFLGLNYYHFTLKKVL